MTDMKSLTQDRTLLVFNCHEPWVYQLGLLGYQLDIVVNLKGKYNLGWDERMRPLPAHARLVTLPEALAFKGSYYCIITHNVADLLDVRSRHEARILVLHHSIEGRIEEETVNCDPEVYKKMLRSYVDLVGAHVVATSMFKGESWGFTDDIVQFGIDLTTEERLERAPEARRLLVDVKRLGQSVDFDHRPFPATPLEPTLIRPVRNRSG